MTTSSDFRSALPFVLTYAEPIERNETPVPVRYDAERQVSQICVDQQWVDTLEGRQDLAATRITRVDQETTDDE